MRANHLCRLHCEPINGQCEPDDCEPAARGRGRERAERDAALGDGRAAEDEHLGVREHLLDRLRAVASQLRARAGQKRRALGSCFFTRCGAGARRGRLTSSVRGKDSSDCARLWQSPGSLGPMITTRFFPERISSVISSICEVCAANAPKVGVAALSLGV